MNGEDSKPEETILSEITILYKRRVQTTFTRVHQPWAWSRARNVFGSNRSSGLWEGASGRAGRALSRVTRPGLVHPHAQGTRAEQLLCWARRPAGGGPALRVPAVQQRRGKGTRIRKGLQAPQEPRGTRTGHEASGGRGEWPGADET